MILRFLIPNCTSITCLSERENPRIFQIRQTDSSMIPSCACEVGRCQNQSTMKKVVVVHKEALGDKARNPTSDGCLSRDNRHLAWHRVSGLFDRFLIDVKPQISCWLLLNRCDIFTTYVTLVIIRGDRCAVEIDTTMSPLLWRAKQAFCETMSTSIPRHFLLRPISKVEGSSRHIS